MSRKQWPWEAIRARCLECVGSPEDVKLCACDPTKPNPLHKDGTPFDNQCHIWPYRFGVPSRTEGTRESEEQAIRKYCLWCCGNSSNEVRLCPSTKCHLWGYRLGQNAGDTNGPRRCDWAKSRTRCAQ